MCVRHQLFQGKGCCVQLALIVVNIPINCRPLMLADYFRCNRHPNLAVERDAGQAAFLRPVRLARRPSLLR